MRLGHFLGRSFGAAGAHVGDSRRDTIEATARIKAAALALLALPEGGAVSVNELLCPDPGCPDLETVILVMSPGLRTRACKIAKPMTEITEQDLAQVLFPAGGAVT